MALTEKRRRRLTIAALVLLVAGGGVWWLLRPEIDPRLVGVWNVSESTIVAHSDRLIRLNLRDDGSGESGYGVLGVVYSRDRFRWWVSGSEMSRRNRSTTKNGPIHELVEEIGKFLSGDRIPLRYQIVDVNADRVVLRSTSDRGPVDFTMTRADRDAGPPAP